jgi:small-conductance mechanosensitive channel
MKLRIFTLAIQVLALFVLGTQLGFANPPAVTTVTNHITPINITTLEQFDSAQANKTFNQTQADINAQRIDIKNLQIDNVLLNKFLLQAKRCIENDNAKLERINQRLQEIGADHSRTTALVQEQSYLTNKKNELLNQQSECQLFLTRSEEVTELLTEKIRDLVKTRLLYAGPNLLDNIANFPQHTVNFFQIFNWQAFAKDLGIGYFAQNPLMLIIAGMLLAAAVVISLQLRKQLQASIGNEKATSFYKQVKQTSLCLLKRHIAPLVILIASAGFLGLVNLSQYTWFDLTSIIFASIAYIVFIHIIRFFFYAPPPAVSFTQLPPSIGKSLTRRFRLLAIFILTAYILHILFQSQHIENTFAPLFKTAFITLICLNLMAIIWVLKKLPRVIYHHNLWRLIISSTLNILLVAIIIAEWFGYHVLAFYLLKSIIATILLVFVAKQISRIAKAGFENLQDPENAWLLGFRNKLGLRKNENPVELFGLRAITYFLIWLFLFLALVEVWGIAQTNFQRLVNGLLYGFRITNFNLIPLRIISGLLCFIVLSLSVRWLKIYIMRKPWQVGQEGGRDSLALIAGYIGFALAFIFGSLIAGVNFSGLLIIAGALSVGIGFGLQGIINNFVSGLVLLIERPIKVGDRIIVGDAEGYVKKISLRSTHITTIQRSDIVLPNSDLITKPVTNYMLYDMDYQVVTKVGIAYGSDTELARSTLLAVAQQHPQVIVDKDTTPQVYFMGFGESSLDFQLYCIIKDINQKTIVLSDLNFAIEKEFRRLNIEIAFPQREITIKNKD